MIRILHLADIHLGARLLHLSDENKRDELRNNLEETFRNIVNFCITPGSRIDIVLICGNLFDSHTPGPELFTFMQEQCNRLLGHHIPIFIIPGSYDSNIYANSIYKESYFSNNVNLITDTNVAHVQTLEVSGEKINIYGMAYSHFTREPADTFKRLDLPGYHIALMHNATVYGEPFIDNEKLKKSGFDYIALGGIPNYACYQHESLAIVYPGMLEPVKPEATAPRILCIVEGHNGILKSYPLQNKFNQKQYKTVELDLTQEVFKNETEIATFLEEKFTNYSYLLRLELKGKINFLLDANRLSKRLGHFFFEVEIDDQTEFDYHSYLSLFKGKNTINALYIRKINELFKSVNTEEARKKIIHAMNIGLALHEN
jgi:DNA repair exonuclease SbcCD nuclease subunit